MNNFDTTLRLLTLNERETFDVFDMTPASNKYKTVKFWDSTIIYEVPEHGNVDLVSLRTPTRIRGNGSARVAMAAFLSATDKHGLTVELGASPLDARTKLSRLVQFYQSMGFELTGEHINMAGDPLMIRHPKNNT